MSRGQAPGENFGNWLEVGKAFIEEVLIVVPVVENSLLINAPVEYVVYAGFVNIHGMKLTVIA